MGKPKSQKPPVIPTAGESLESVINTLTEKLPELQALQLADALGELSRFSKTAPGWATAQLAQEAQFGPLQRAAASEAQRQSAMGQIFNVGNISPSLRQAQASADPESAALRQELNRQVGTELSAGAGLDPELRREFQQNIRSAQGARGISQGAAPISEEALFVGGRALQLRQQRQQAASNLIRLNQSTQVSPFQLLGGGAPQLMGGGGGQQGGGGFLGGRGGGGGGGLSAGGMLPGLLSQTQQQQQLQAKLNFNAASMAPSGLMGMGGSAGGAGSLGLAAAGAGLGAPGIGIAALLGAS